MFKWWKQFCINRRKKDIESVIFDYVEFPTKEDYAVVENLLYGENLAYTRNKMKGEDDE